ncbi:GH92 family glycosyl hydrolase [Niabella beijingensis]|uniref:GH92 family glycosyl hydrolase n=1 Tax=Niabella beijingensis TaxID=2872700 RepID=UPI001CBE6EEC|nr:GH92 family glycosyl hydrolase [Niabella beijingensis]MBZ4192239.1 GH92 family glycosyl hydrolase [Niabella beijingensis]
MNKNVFWKILLAGCFAGMTFFCSAQERVIWSIGKKDNSAAEFALAPDRYADFLKEDFGWENRQFIVGRSDPRRDWPYVLPGPADGWGGTGPTAGIRTQVLNILFDLKSVDADKAGVLIVDVLHTHVKLPPYLKITVNGRSYNFRLPPGADEAALTGKNDNALHHTLTIPLDTTGLKTGINEIQLTSLEGSWMVFDDIRLEGSTKTVLNPVPTTVLVRDVKAAPWQLNAAVQPLLINVAHTDGTPLLQVKLDGKTIFNKKLEAGPAVLEAPMEAVTASVESKYTVIADGKEVASGTVVRSPLPLVQPSDYVNTFLGTAHSRWMIAPGPWMPFSMVKLSPDNQNAGWQAGYDPIYESIGTFSHVHEWTMAGLGMLPVNGPLKIKMGDEAALKYDSTGYRSFINKATEEAPLGYYKADLTTYNIKAELTSTSRCSFQRYTYPQQQDGRVMIDLKIPAEYDYKILKASLTQIDAHTIEGYSVQQSKNVWSADADQDYTLYFRIEFDQPIKKIGGWVNDTITGQNRLDAAHPNQMGCYVEFDTHENPVVQVRTGISYVDAAGARRNLQEEVSAPFGWDFNAVRQHNVKTWNDLLRRVTITSDDSREKMRFYTNLYRSFCRNTFSDVDGRWVDATEKIQQLKTPEDAALGCDAFWNTFWNLNQVWNLVAPEWSGKWVRSQLAMFNANGWLAKGPAGMEYIPVMVGEHEIPLLVSAYQMGIRDYDTEDLFRAVVKTATASPERVGNGFAGNRDIEAFLKYKYVPADKGRFSNTLEYAYDNWTIGQLAEALHKPEEAQFKERGNWWKHAIDTVTGYARMRYSSGEWEKNFDPYKSGANHHYVEGNAWQLTYFVPQDVPALIRAIGKGRFTDRLTKGFKASEPWRYNAPGDQYWDFPVVQGNQQSMHFAFLFNWAGQPWQTQQWSRSILDRYYGFGVADAYLGDEDQGQMSSWFVMAALGLFQTDGGCNVIPHYEITSPLYKQVVIDLGNRYGRGKQFVISAPAASRENKYIQRARLNGRILNSFRFPASELLKGGTLELEMGSRPNKTWGTGQ